MASATTPPAEIPGPNAKNKKGTTKHSSIQIPEITKPPAKKSKKSAKAIDSPLATSPMTSPATLTPAPATEPKKQGASRPRKTPTQTPIKPSTAGTKRQATAADLPADDTNPTPAKRRKAEPKAPKTPRKPKKTGATEVAAPATPQTCPLPQAVQNKILGVRTFLRSHKHLAPPPLSLDKTDDTLTDGDDNSTNTPTSHTAFVDEDDILAALLILRADYSLNTPFSNRYLTLADAGGMIVSSSHTPRFDPSPYVVEIDFLMTCPLEHAAQKKIRGWGGELEGVNLVVVEVMMLRERRERFVRDGFRCGGVWGFGGGWGSDEEGAVAEDVLGEEEIADDQAIADQANGQVVGEA